MNIFSKIPKKNGIYSVYGVNNLLESILLKELLSKKNIFYFTEDIKDSKAKFDILSKNSDSEINYLDNSFFEDSISLEKLPLISEIFNNFSKKSSRVIIFDSIKISKNINIDKRSLSFKINPDDTQITQNEIIKKLLKFNFNQTEFVNSFGDFSVRGSVLDLFSQNFEKPIRIQFYKEKIKSTSYFNLDTMKSGGKILTSFDIYKYNHSGDVDKRPIIELIPKNSFIILDHQWNNENQEIIKEISKYNIIIFINPLIELGKEIETLEIEYPEIQYETESLSWIKQLLKKYKDNKFTFLITKENDMDQIRDEVKNLSYNIYCDEYSKTFTIKNKKEIFVSLKKSEEKLINKFDEFKKLTHKFRNFSELKMGDFIVHKKYGICLYNGLIQKEINNTIIEFVKCKFQNDDYLFVPSIKINLLQKYVGNKNEINIDSLRSKTWKVKVTKAKKIAEKVAKEILALYAKRKVVRGFSFDFNPIELNEFEKNFEYQETPDQLKAINDVYEDMKRNFPMDRLICGDVGFGKTEIALRAAYIASMNSKQVAIIAPTTLLVNQHLNTFLQRFKDFPINIKSVSRNTSLKEFKNIILELKNSKIDILIGTHRILNEKLIFKNLGLVIIDEEHKFGVKHKEKIKEIRLGLDYLALSATPIPRTLQLSLSGIKDISIIATPPLDRFSIDTQIHLYNEEIIKNAINFELNRKGRVFFIHNEIKSIEKTYNSLKKLLPEVKMAFIHGKMKPNVIEDNILDFIDGKISVLITTTIIESGIDIKEANTIIINNANKFGLSDLYQIRGRIGRGSEKGYAYLILDQNKKFNKNAIRRLDAIKTLSSLGSGFNLAMEDLEIRGAGNLFGTDQSGNIYDVGVEFYLDLLDSEIRKINNSIIDDEMNIEINTKDKINIPADYISSAEKRIYYYKRISCIESADESIGVIEELIDLFGLIPEEISKLIKLSELKIKLKKLQITDFQMNQTNMILKINSLQKLKNFKVFFIKFDGKIDSAKKIFDKIDNIEKYIEKFSKFENNKFIINLENENEI